MIKFIITYTFVTFIIGKVLHLCKYNTHHFLIPDDDDDDAAVCRNRGNAMLAKKRWGGDKF